MRGCGSVPSAGLCAHRLQARTFTNRALKAEWAGRLGHTSVIDAAGAIYVIGGFGSTYFQDVWASTNGGARRGTLGYYMGVLQGYLGGSKRY